MQKTTELYISSVLDKPVINPAGRVVGKLWDVAVAPGGSTAGGDRALAEKRTADRLRALAAGGVVQPLGGFGGRGAGRSPLL